MMETSLEGQSEISIKEKFKEEWAKADFTVTPEVANRVGIALFWYTLIIFSTTVSIYILPAIIETNTLFWFLEILVIYIFINSFLNWFLCFNNHSDIVFCTSCNEINKFVVKAAPDSNICDRWKYCIICQCESPPRSHHCKLCQTCILKRDHHCFFTGRCIGHTTQRRFIVLTFYSLLACNFAFIAIGVYLTSQFSFSENWSMYILPITFLYWLFSNIKLGFLFHLLNMYIAFAIGFLSAMFLIWELMITCKGTTSYEIHKRIRRYEMSTFESLSSVFGPWGFVHFIFPFKIYSKHDGCNWKINQKTK